MVFKCNFCPPPPFIILSDKEYERIKKDFKATGSQMPDWILKAEKIDKDNIGQKVIDNLNNNK